MVSEDSGADVPRSFLLIARTSRIFTAADFATSTGGSPGFPANSQISFSELQRSSL